MKTEPKQGVSKFTEKDLTPLEKHVTSELEKIQAGHEGYKVVPDKRTLERNIWTYYHADSFGDGSKVRPKQT